MQKIQVFFTDQQFTHGIESSTNKDASDIQEYLRDLFTILNLPNSQRATNKAYLQQFPYVNGGLFKDSLAIPKISVKARTLILDCGRLDWCHQSRYFWIDDSSCCNYR